MGLYINPPKESKELFLEKYGSEIPTHPITLPTDDKVVVCLMDNGPFTAAGVCYDERELAEFSRPDDLRPKKWYLLPRHLLSEVCPEKMLETYLPSNTEEKG